MSTYQACAASKVRLSYLPLTAFWAHTLYSGEAEDAAGQCWEAHVQEKQQWRRSDRLDYHIAATGGQHSVRMCAYLKQTGDRWLHTLPKEGTGVAVAACAALPELLPAQGSIAGTAGRAGRDGAQRAWNRSGRSCLPILPEMVPASISATSSASAAGANRSSSMRVRVSFTSHAQRLSIPSRCSLALEADKAQKSKAERQRRHLQLVHTELHPFILGAQGTLKVYARDCVPCRGPLPQHYLTVQPYATGGQHALQRAMRHSMRQLAAVFMGAAAASMAGMHAVL